MNKYRQEAAKTEAIHIAQTILDQIGHWNIAAFGVPRNSIQALCETDLRLGGVRFRATNNPKLRSGIVVIELMASDLYTVTIVNVLGFVIAKHEDVYCDQLTQILDDELG